MLSIEAAYLYESSAWFPGSLTGSNLIGRLSTILPIYSRRLRPIRFLFVTNVRAGPPTCNLSLTLKLTSDLLEPVPRSAAGALYG